MFLWNVKLEEYSNREEKKESNMKVFFSFIFLNKKKHTMLKATNCQPMKTRSLQSQNANNG